MFQALKIAAILIQGGLAGALNAHATIGPCTDSVTDAEQREADDSIRLTGTEGIRGILVPARCGDLELSTIRVWHFDDGTELSRLELALLRYDLGGYYAYLDVADEALEVEFSVVYDGEEIGACGCSFERTWQNDVS